MKIAVTGCCGFVGKYIIKELVKCGSDVVGIDIGENIFDANIKKKMKFIQANIYKADVDYFELFKKPDVVIHLVWENLSNYRDLVHIEKSLMKNYFFLKNLIENGLKSLSVIGTCYEYGLQEGALNEDLETKPIIPYATAKDSLRKFIEELQKKYNFYFKWIRLFYLFGEGQGRNSIFEQLRNAITNKDTVFNMSGGEQLRDYLPVERVADNIIRISMQNNINGIINCSSGTPISIRKMVENYLSENKLDIKLNLGYYPYLDYEPMAFWGDNRKLKEIIKE